MPAETNLDILLKNLRPRLNEGDFVYCTLKDAKGVDPNDALLIFREEEGTTLIVRKETADQLGIDYSFIAAWITLTAHSALEAVGLTAAFSDALARNGISCNVVAAFYHDHIFVDRKDASRALEVLNAISNVRPQAT